MKQIKYSPDVADKLRSLKKTITMQYGRNKAQQIVGKNARDLGLLERMMVT